MKSNLKLQPKTIKQNLLPRQEVPQNELYQISKITTFYLKDWRQQKHWAQNQSIEKQRTEAKQSNKNSTKNKSLIKEINLKKRSSSLPLLKSLSSNSNYLPNPILKINKSQLQLFQKPKDCESTLKDSIYSKILKRNLEIQKRLVKQIDNEVVKLKKSEQINYRSQKALKNNLIDNAKNPSFQKQFTLIGSKTKKIIKSYNNQYNNQFHNSLQQVENINHKDYSYSVNILNKRLIFKKNQAMQNLDKKSRQIKDSIYIKQNDDYQENNLNDQKIAINNNADHSIKDNKKCQKGDKKYSVKNEKNTIKVQLKAKQFKLHMKKQYIGQILRKYDPTYHDKLNPQKLIDLKQVQKLKKRQIIKGIIMNHKLQPQLCKTPLHSTLLHNYRQFKHVEQSILKNDIIKLIDIKDKQSKQ